jgi:hypothetical protein
VWDTDVRPGPGNDDDAGVADKDLREGPVAVTRFIDADQCTEDVPPLAALDGNR